jgi:hypothetical protein
MKLKEVLRKRSKLTKNEKKWKKDNDQNGKGETLEGHLKRKKNSF